MHSPIVALIRNRNAKAALKKLPLQLVSVSSYHQLVHKKADMAPRLSIVEAAVEPDRLPDVISSLRKMWPVADIVVWAPKAPGRLVRSAFRAGAKDVVVSTVVARLLDCCDSGAATMPTPVLLC
jgi:hypothetical protein